MSSLTLGIRLVGVQTPEYLLCVGFLTKIDYSIDSITKIIMRNVHPAQTQTWTGVVALEQSADGTWFMGQLQKKKTNSAHCRVPYLNKRKGLDNGSTFTVTNWHNNTLHLLD